MGKRVLAALLAVAGFGLLARPQVAQEANPGPATSGTGFVAGKFLTAEDYEHMEASLACINLKPGDLKYEKKHRPDDKLRLKVCDAALDDPMGLPLVTENAAAAYSASAAELDRFIQVAMMLEAPPVPPPVSRLSELESALAKAEEVKDKDKAAALLKEVNDALYGASYGGVPEILVEPGITVSMRWEPEFEHARYFVNAAEYLHLLHEVEFEASGLATFLPTLFAEADLSLADARVELGDGFVEAAKVGLNHLLAAGQQFQDSVASEGQLFREILAVATADGENTAGQAHSIEGVTGTVVAAWKGPWGKYVIGGTGPNTYEGDDFIGIIDLGGEDVYKGRVACGIGLAGKAPLSFVLDLGGNDRYEGEDFTQGFGFLGVGILHDLGGGDDYYKSRFCAQGCGLCGYGELYDDGGDDIYLADSGAQGAGCFGYGHLIDKAGNDVYRGARYVQAFAQVMGVGVLTDGAGNDLYYAGGKYLHQPLWNDRYQSLSQGFAIGNRNDRGVGTGGGVALLLDEGNGNDVYQCDIYGQGSSYWYSLGMLVDRGGNDTYTLGQYGQGAGIHLSAAILYDESGNDTYSMGVGLGQGAAHDWAVGWQIDRAGNDFYQGNGQGMGLNFSIGVLLDCAGDDSHCTNNEGSIGKGSNNDISLLLDLAGTDSYGPKEIKDAQFTRRGDHQLVYDVPQGWFPSIDTSTWPTKQDPAPTIAVVQHILIAWDGTGIDTQKAARTKEKAYELTQQVMKQARSKGADWKQLQADYNEDCAANLDGTTNTHNKYTASANARLVKSFNDLALGLGVGQINVCESKYGYHIIKRVE
jgi:hypothetical protein